MPGAAVEVLAQVTLMARFSRASSYFKQIRYNAAIRQERMQENLASLSILNKISVSGSASRARPHPRPV